MVKLSGLDGKPVYIWPLWVQAVRAALPSEVYGGHRALTKVVMSGETIFLPDPPEEVAAALSGGSDAG